MAKHNYNGHWEEISKDEKIWKGEFYSSEKVGKVTINYIMDRIQTIDNVKISETKRKNIINSMKNGNPDIYRYEDDDGSWIHGHIIIQSDDVIFKPIKIKHKEPKKQKYDLEYDMFKNKDVMSFVQDEKSAKELYAALCNVQWFFENQRTSWSCSWRGAGRIIANMRQKGEEYVDFYCSGNEGNVSPQVKKLLKKMNWKPKTTYNG